jgi:NitT/TauT family transport system permease protein
MTAGSAAAPELRPGEAAAAAELEAAAPRIRVRSRAARWRTLLVFLILLVVLWEGLKLLGGDTIRSGEQVLWDPPLTIPFASDLSLPHLPAILASFAAPVQRGSSSTLLQYLIEQAAATWLEALIGFVAGAVLGLVLAIVFVHSQLLERAFVPYVIASQTVPILALAPMVVLIFGPYQTSVAIVSTYLTFFPVTIAMIRGLRSPDPRALELMRSYAASRATILRKVRLPASLPYLFTALKIAATASIVGAIVGEGSGNNLPGLGRAILDFSQYYITGPEKLWAAIIVSGALGILFFSLVGLAERRVLRQRPDAEPA